MANGYERKVIITAVILLAGTFLTLFAGTGTSASLYQSPGTVIDFGDRNTVWTELDLNEYSDPYDVLEAACSANYYDYLVDESSTIIMIDGIEADSTHSWDLWVVVLGETEWTKLSVMYDADLSEYAVSSWAYTENGAEPTVGVDAAGNSIYGYAQASTTVALSPSITEIIGALGGVNTLVGTDKYSNYPEEVVELQESGDIAIVGDYTTPVYENIVKTDPDIVYCDSSQYNHITMNSTLRNANIVSILLYDGTGFDTILDNIYIVGLTMGYNWAAESLIEDMLACMDEIADESMFSESIMAALSPDAATWVAGTYTYVDDVINEISCTNVFSGYVGWVHINPEMIALLNPSYIVIITSSFSATQEDYDQILSILSSEWKSTDAYKNGHIYVICESAADMAQRAGPRNVQLMELMSVIVNSDSDIPNYFGDNYRDYLTITKDY